MMVTLLNENENWGLLSFVGYIMGVSLLAVDFLLRTSEESKIFYIFLHVTSLCVMGLLFSKVLSDSLLIWYCANFLGYCLAAGIMIANSYEPYSSFGWYMISMSAFHYLEFLTTALTNPANLSIDSYLLNHSMQYGFAAITSWIEYAVELWAFPSMKIFSIFSISGIGVFICLFGDSLRKLAMFHAGQNFNHIVQGTKSKDHELVTHGVFSIVRHPSYVGWFLWSIGTQVILWNPLCSIAYAIVSWKFFADRICIEEYTLLHFFGEEYRKYQENVPFTGIPFIKGYKWRP